MPPAPRRRSGKQGTTGTGTNPRALPGNLVVHSRAIADLLTDPANARRHSERNIKVIAESLRVFGQQSPIVIDSHDVVRKGNGTLEAAQRLGWESIDVVVTTLTGDKLAAYGVADNRSAELANWDPSQLADTLGSLDPDLVNAAGFKDSELKALAAKLAADDPDPDELGDADDDPAEDETARYAERVKNPRTKDGDVWLLGRHRLACGDSFDPAHVDRLLGGKSVKVDAVLTDPPYAIYGSSSGIGSDVADDRMVRPFFEQLTRVLVARTKLFGHVYIHCDWRSWAALQNGARVAGLSVKNMIVWDKQSQGMGNMYAHTHELIGFFVPEPPPKAMSSGRKTGHRQVLKSNIVRFPRVTGKEREHNAAKPVPLLTEFISNSTDEGQTVLDLFGGSGSTLVACEGAGRVCFVSEQDPRWCDVIAARWQRLTGQKPELHRPGQRPRKVDLSKPLTRSESA